MPFSELNLNENEVEGPKWHFLERCKLKRVCELPLVPSSWGMRAAPQGNPNSPSIAATTLLSLPSPSSTHTVAVALLVHPSHRATPKTRLYRRYVVVLVGVAQPNPKSISWGSCEERSSSKAERTELEREHMERGCATVGAREEEQGGDVGYFPATLAAGLGSRRR